MHGQVFDVRHEIEVTPYTPTGITRETIFWWVQFSRESHMWNISICSNLKKMVKGKPTVCRHLVWQ